MNIETLNAKQFPKLYYARHFTPGVVRYDNGDLMVTREAIENMAATAEGKPVYINHQSVDMEGLHNADGVLIDCFQHPYDGWFYSRMMLTSDAAHEARAKGWKVSNAYLKLAEDTTGGTYLNIPFHSKLTKGSFTHMALTPTPRYEEAAILSPEEYRAYTASAKARFEQLQNSKPEGKKMLKFFKKVEQEVTDLDPEAMIRLEDGREVSLQEMMNAVATAAKPAPAKPPLPTTKVMVGDVEMSVADLVAKFTELKNSGGEDGAGDESTDDNANGAGGKTNPAEVPSGDGAKPNAPAGDKPADDSKPAGGADGKDHFKELSNAHLSHLDPIANIEGSADQLARGKELFGL